MCKLGRRETSVGSIDSKMRKYFLYGQWVSWSQINRGSYTVYKKDRRTLFRHSFCFFWRRKILVSNRHPLTMVCVIYWFSNVSYSLYFHDTPPFCHPLLGPTPPQKSKIHPTSLIRNDSSPIDSSSNFTHSLTRYTYRPLLTRPSPLPVTFPGHLITHRTPSLPV